MDTGMTLGGRCRQLQPRALFCLLAIQALAGLAACNNDTPTQHGGGATPSPSAPTTTNLRMRFINVLGQPVIDADITLTHGSVQNKAVTDGNGVVTFGTLPNGAWELDAIAGDFEAINMQFEFGGGDESWQFTMLATGAWAIGRVFVLGTETVDRAADGSTLTFSVDLAVIDANAQANETLSSADFELATFDCGWFGPRDCASDAEGRATNDYNGAFSIDSGAEQLEILPGSAAHPWLASVLAERSSSIWYWNERAPALKDFFASTGTGDLVGLSSVQLEGGESTLTELGPFTNDGSQYFTAIDELAAASGDAPEILPALLESIQRAADAAPAGTTPTLLVLASPWMSVSAIDTAATLARDRGVQISTVLEDYPHYGFSELAVRTGGFSAVIADPRQFGMVFAAVDEVLAGTLSRYRMHFRIRGPANTFVPGGNAKVWLVVRPPTNIINRGVWTTFDVAIP